MNLFSQDFTERTYYVNPDSKKNKSFRLNGTKPEKEISLDMVSDRFYVEYNIYDSARNLVYSKNENNYLELTKELFFTEDSLIYISIPPFEWKGEINNDEYHQVRDINDNKAPDGEYILRINISSDIIKRRQVIKYRDLLSRYKIIVKETPPDFKVDYIYVPYKGETPIQDVQYYIFILRGMLPMNGDMK